MTLCLLKTCQSSPGSRDQPRFQYTLEEPYLSMSGSFISAKTLVICFGFKHDKTSDPSE